MSDNISLNNYHHEIILTSLYFLLIMLFFSILRTMWKKSWKVITGVSVAVGVTGATVFIAAPKIIELRNLRVKFHRSLGRVSLTEKSVHFSSEAAKSME